jgi:putative addiction module component (TIGR02574 family)
MSNEAQEILARALELPVTERARLAADLLDSLDDEEYEDSPEEVQQAWAEEIERRAEAFHRGDYDGEMRDADTVIADIRRDILGR